MHWLAAGVAAVTVATLLAFSSDDAEAIRSDHLTGSLGLSTALEGTDAPRHRTVTLDLPDQGTEPRDLVKQGAIKAVSLTPPGEEPAKALSMPDTQPADQRADHRADRQAPGPADAPAEDSVEATEAIDDDIDWESVTVRRGDSLARIFDREGLSPKALHAIMQLDETKPLARLHPGDTVKLYIEDSRLERLAYDLSEIRTLHIHRTPDGFETDFTERQLETRYAYAGNVIDTSLFMAANESGLTDRLAMQLASIFGWDIDFVLDIRRGDRFAVLYEELYLNGEKVRNGDIIAAEFVNRGESFRAVRFEDAGGRVDYYTPEGRSVRRTFLRTPVDFTRISSRFSRGRHHPVLNRIRAHKGVDYAAPTGTPIKATADGKVVYRGRKGGYGHAIILKHGATYSTLYAHMSRFAGRARTGRWVKQGQIIGYVGASGLATGPHLHYEFRVNGVHRNPLTVDLPEAKPIAERYRADFQQVAERRIAQLETIKRTQVASSE